jgi:hypothetical protein
MTITIKNIKRRPGGRESIREQEFDKDEISIGRDAGSDLPLNDLSLSLHHAVLKRGQGGLAILELIGGNSANVNGRLITGRAAKLRSGTIIKLGRFDLKIEEPSGRSNITATLEQVEAVEATLNAEDEDAVFGLKRALPSKRLMAWVFSIGIFAFFLSLPIWAYTQRNADLKTPLPVQADLSWNSGPISLMRSNLKSDCATCHETAFTPVKDQACTSCHTDIFDHASKTDMQVSKPTPNGFDKNLLSIGEMFGRDQGRCVSCHVEHNTRAKIVPTDQKFCGDCHGNLDHSLPSTKLGNVTDFTKNHPEFSPSVITVPDFKSPKVSVMSLGDDPKGFSGLKFPHKLHMEIGGGVAKMAGRLGVEFGFEDGLECADCHRPEAGGALFDPVNMREDCAMCHSLVFEDDDGYQRTLRHGEPEEVIASMRDFYQAKALANIRDAEMNSRTRRRPGRAASLRDLNRRELAFKQADERTAAKVEAIFSKGGSCFDCHEVDRPTEVGSLDFRLKPISLNDQFYFKSDFNHSSHEIGNLECKTCHLAEKSKSSADVLLPKIEVCQDCHVGEESYRKGGTFADGALPTTCLTCHSYHGGPHAEKMSLEK